MDGFDNDNAFGSSAAVDEVADAGVANDQLVADEVDPAAQFLAQEQEDLGGLGEDLGFTNPTVQDISSPAAIVQNGDTSSEFLMVEKEVEHDGDGISDVNPFNLNFQMPSDQSGSMDNLSRDMNNVGIKEEPESIKKWKLEQVSKLKLKDEQEEKNKDELKKQALKELEDWYKHYNVQLEKTKEDNRNAQETFVSEVNDIQPGTEWERVAKQCDFNAKTTRNTKDVSRMRSILLQLKQNPPTRD